MLKAMGRFFLFFAIMLAVAAGSGYVTYIVTSNMLKNSISGEIQTTSAKTGEPEQKMENKEAPKDDKPLSFDYYIVRLEGENLGVYASCNGREEFLYNESIYTRDLSSEDLSLLKGGVKLKNSSELTGFIENFTS